MAKRPTKADAARELIKKFPKLASLTLGRMLYEQNSTWFPTQDAANQCIRYARGKRGGRLRRSAKVACPDTVLPKRHKWVHECPPSAAEPWLPVPIDGPAKILSLSDTHFPYHDKDSVEAAVKWGKKFKPDVIVLNGDWMDFYGISRFEKNPKARDFKYEIEIGRDSLSWLRGSFPAARIIYKLGNHDDRWDKFIWKKAPEIWNIDNVQLHNLLHFEDFGIERVGDNPIMAGLLPVFHGHELGKGISSPVNPARGAFLRTLHTILVGHHHRSSSHAEPNLWHDETMTWSQGCLCDRTPEYARVNKWNLGFAAIEVAADNEFNLHNLRISNDYKVRTA